MRDREAEWLGEEVLIRRGINLREDLSYEEWLTVGQMLSRVERNIQWWIGDWLNFGERKYGKQYEAAIEVTPYDYGTLRNFKSISAEFELSRRRDNLSWSHHCEVAGLPIEQQERLLDSAEMKAWTQKELRLERHRLVNSIGELPDSDTCTVADLEALRCAGKKFGTIYADPPWLYSNQGTRSATGNHYGGMTVTEIAALPIKDLAAEDAHLHLWTTNAFLFDCPAIISAWGFEYKSCFVWVKPQMGIGNYWRVSHEFMLFGIRGSAPFRDHSSKSWLECDRTEHSAKPDSVRRLIENASPPPYLELFGRRVADHWTVWGNQIKRTMFDGEIAALE